MTTHGIKHILHSETADADQCIFQKSVLLGTFNIFYIHLTNPLHNILILSIHLKHELNNLGIGGFNI